MMTHHPDIEIYIKNSSVEKIVHWLNNRFENVELLSIKGLLHHYEAHWQTHRFTFTIHQRALGKAWISIWFQSDQTPWQIDLECAREASKELNAQIRCIDSGWQEGDDPDEWWKIENGLEEKIAWITE